MKKRKINLKEKKKKFMKPDKTKLLYPKPCNYSKLNENGIVDKDTYVTEDDILIGKGIPIKNNSNYNYRDNSTTLRKNENGFVDDSHITTNSDGYKVCKTRIESYRS